MLLTDEQWKRFQDTTPVFITGGVNVSAIRTEVLKAMSVDEEKFSKEDRIKMINILERRRKAMIDDRASNCKPLPETDLRHEFYTNLKIVLDDIYSLLMEKNRKYGNSVSEPIGVFSKLSPIEAINVRIDDKLARIRSGQSDETEDSELDLIGYLILKRVLRYEQKPE